MLIVQKYLSNYIAVFRKFCIFVQLTTTKDNKDMKTFSEIRNEIDNYLDEIIEVKAMSLEKLASEYNVDATEEERSEVISVIKEEIAALERYIEINEGDLYEEEELRAEESYYDMKYSLSNGKWYERDFKTITGNPAFPFR